MWISILEYVSISRNKLCSDKGMLSTYNTDKCKDAITAIGINGSIRTETIEGYPSGCYVHDNGNVFFNFYPNGLRQGSARPICKSYGQYSNYSRYI